MKDYTVIDLEMTGMNPKTDHILEIGAVQVRNHKIVDRLNLLINPGIPIPELIVELTGIQDADVKDGYQQEEAFRITEAFLGDDILVGHSIIFDYSFLKQQAINLKVPFEKRAVDTLKLARHFLPEEQKKSLEALCYYYQIPRDHGHRAVYDAEMTYALYEILERDYLEKDEEAFVPTPLIYKAKKQTPASPAQKRRLKELLEYHHLEIGIPFDTLTRSEASRQTDRIISQYGRMPKGTNHSSATSKKSVDS